MSENTIAVQNFGSFLIELYAGKLIILKREVDGYVVSREKFLHVAISMGCSRVIFAIVSMNIDR